MPILQWLFPAGLPTARRLDLRLRFPVNALATVCLAAALAGCSRPAPVAEEIRPVRAIVVKAQSVDVMAEFPGEVRARIETRPGFRVPGKIIAREVEVGSRVKPGQVLMRLDPTDLKLAQTQSEAALSAAQSNLAFARADVERYRDLRQKNFVSQAALEAKEAAFQSAQASARQATAALHNQANQAGYAVLTSDRAGAVTAIDAEVGQVVAAGTPVLRIAEGSEKEVAIAVPEDKVDSLRHAQTVRLSFWSLPGTTVNGSVREISPIADPATRTYAVKIALPDAPASIQLGMSATASFLGRAVQSQIRLPLTALMQQQGQTGVWVVEGGTVHTVPVILAGAAGNDVLVAQGLKGGETVVTAGVHLLKPGQKVRILGDALTGVDAQPGAVGGGK